jgi:Uma2 family endonuclease
MIQALQQPVTFEEFIEWKPNDGQYELRKGVILERQPKGKHEEITGFLIAELTFQARVQKLPYFSPKQALVKSPTDENSAYLPDILLVDSRELSSEPYWERASTLTQGSSIPMIVEVVSSNWRDDYLTKLSEYEELGVPEYWIVDYAAFGGRRFIGNPKQPTLSVYRLVEGEYELQPFRAGDSLSETLHGRILSHYPMSCCNRRLSNSRTRRAKSWSRSNKSSKVSTGMARMRVGVA